MKKIVFFLGIILFVECSPKKGKSSQLLINLDTIPRLANVRLENEFPSSLYTLYLDSANKFKLGEPIPFFFYNHLLDYQHPWLTDHHSFSLRKLIIDSTNNMKVLEEIIKSNDLRLRRIVDSIEVSNISLLMALPYREVSNYEMVQKRLKQGK